jgi:hypothetical protein
MSVKLILLLILVGLVCYILGRLSGGRRDGGGQMLQTRVPHMPGAAHLAYGGSLDAASLEEVKRLIREQQLISAIRIYRERTNCGLREAKDAVEAIARTL